MKRTMPLDFKTVFIVLFFLVIVSSSVLAFIEPKPWSFIDNWLLHYGDVKILGNLSIDGNFFNVSVINYNVTGNIDVLGNITAKEFVGNTSQWSRNGNNVFLTTSTDKVGIGTANPEHKLDVEGNSEIANLIICDNGAATIMTRNKTLAISKGCSI